MVYKQQSDISSSSSSGPVLAHLHDAASSWWTQTAASSQQQLEVVRAVAAAAGRYMHVMWPQVGTTGLQSSQLAALEHCCTAETTLLLNSSSCMSSMHLAILQTLGHMSA
jgi:hypothetical protein